MSDETPTEDEREQAAGVSGEPPVPDTESKPGSGLGLSIVADLAHLYKGHVELEPSPEGGLRARLELPAA